MRKLEMLLVVVALALMALAMALLVAHREVAECVDLVAGGCQEVGFAYEGGGKLALLTGFVLLLTAALMGLVRGADERRK